MQGGIPCSCHPPIPATAGGLWGFRPQDLTSSYLRSASSAMCLASFSWISWISIFSSSFWARLSMTFMPLKRKTSNKTQDAEPTSANPHKALQGFVWLSVTGRSEQTTELLLFSKPWSESFQCWRQKDVYFCFLQMNPHTSSTGETVQESHVK